jgi:AhpD family alkylhydroperoxidase
MDDRTRTLISLGAATAANCVPCFEHYFRQADIVGLSSEEIQEAADIARQVKKGADNNIRNRISELTGNGRLSASQPKITSERSCCG